MAMRFPSCWAPFQTLSAAPPRVASRSVRKGTRLAVAIHGTRVPPRAQAVVPRSPKARRRGAAADCALRDGGAGNSRRRGEGAEHGARRGFPRRPARNVRDCSRDVTTRELPPAGAGAGSHTSAAAREPRPGLPRGRAAALARFDRAERCCSERRHFGSEAVCVTESPRCRSLLPQLLALGRKSGGSRSAAAASFQSGETPGAAGDCLSECFLLNRLQKQSADGAETTGNSKSELSLSGSAEDLTLGHLCGWHGYTAEFIKFGMLLLSK
ncbi:uncharacterized protein LOC110389670 isoform X1 [Numida meleagris]|uniref:uncharacterized protein LOC110389670 isoform X1 n=1 Tax=Numida meleagris TaxID=8996 RepID=UPI000B3DDF6B|nr:uncharacterized protein LOC110389670 isoform X1 [Numida meleagris]